MAVLKDFKCDVLDRFSDVVFLFFVLSRERQSDLLRKVAMVDILHRLVGGGLLLAVQQKFCSRQWIAIWDFFLRLNTHFVHISVITTPAVLNLNRLDSLRQV